MLIFVDLAGHKIECMLFYLIYKNCWAICIFTSRLSSIFVCLSRIIHKLCMAMIGFRVFLDNRSKKSIAKSIFPNLK